MACEREKKYTNKPRRISRRWVLLFFHDRLPQLYFIIYL